MLSKVLVRVMSKHQISERKTFFDKDFSTEPYVVTIH